MLRPDFGAGDGRVDNSEFRDDDVESVGDLDRVEGRFLLPVRGGDFQR